MFSVYVFPEQRLKSRFLSYNEVFMKLSWFSFYTLVLALWVGGITMFTFIVTPVIFKAFPRDMAGDIVGKLFPGYFLYNLILSAFTFVIFFLVSEDRSGSASRISLILIAAALIINVFITFKLHPEAVRVKQAVTSFEREPKDSPARKEFTRLHALSAALNLALLADGIALLLASPALKK
jgi:hypothetical protein